MKRRKKTAVKDRISQTVLNLFKEKNISDIRISEVTEKAQVARASFYRNFGSFDDVLEYIADGYVNAFSEQYLPLLYNGNYDTWYEKVKEILGTILEKKDSINDTLTNNLRIVFYKFEQKIVLNPNHIWSMDPYKKYEHVAKISAFYSVCCEWIKDGAKESIDDMAAFIVTNILLNAKVA